MNFDTNGTPYEAYLQISLSSSLSLSLISIPLSLSLSQHTHTILYHAWVFLFHDLIYINFISPKNVIILHNYDRSVHQIS
jgi:hypothetical protein